MLSKVKCIEPSVFQIHIWYGCNCNRLLAHCKGMQACTKITNYRWNKCLSTDPAITVVWGGSFHCDRSYMYVIMGATKKYYLYKATSKPLTPPSPSPYTIHSFRALLKHVKLNHFYTWNKYNLLNGEVIYFK